jgi:hypothetical protein
MLDNLLDSYQSFTGHTEYAGIDKIRITYPLDKELSDGSDDLFTKHGVRKTLAKGGELQYAKGSVPGPNGDNVFFEVRNNASTAVVEFNPSRSIDPDGSTLCSPDLIDNLVIAVIRYLGRHTVVPIWVIDRHTGEFVLENPDLWPVNWRKAVEINRIDCARDIYSPYLGFGTRSMLGLKKPNFTTDTLFRNNGTVETITWGRKNNVRHCFYNKSLKHDKVANGGWFRFEIQMTTHFLKNNGIASLEDVTSGNVFRLLWHRWNVSNLDTAISIGEGQANLVVQLRKHLSGNQVQTFLGLAVSYFSGFPVEMHQKTLKTYREVGKKIGFNFGQSLDSYGNIQIRIDFARGELVEVEQEDSLEFAQTETDISGNILEKIGA